MVLLNYNYNYNYYYYYYYSQQSERGVVRELRRVVGLQAVCWLL